MVVQNLRDFEKAEEECSFMLAVAKGMVEQDQGHEASPCRGEKTPGTDIDQKPLANFRNRHSFMSMILQVKQRD